MTDGPSPRAAEALRAATGAPTGAEVASDRLAPLLRWLALRPEPADLVLACCAATGAEPVTVPHPGVVVIALPVCAATLPVSGWLELALAGARAVSVPAHPGCPPWTGRAPCCPVHPGRPASTRWPPGNGPATAVGRVWRAPVLGVERLDLPRRGVIARCPAPAARRLRAAGHRAGRLLATLAALGLDPGGWRGRGRRRPGHPSEPIGTASPALDVLPAAELVADDCTACGVCARSCPEHALALVVDPDGGPARLHQAPLSCTDCGICVAICPAGALHRAGVLAPGDRTGTRELAVLPVTTCRRCRAAVAVSVVSGDGLCPVCAERRRNPFGSTLHNLGPAGAVRGTR
ncbi:ATP-binding protein [Cellulomonas denverensis]|uniref:ATP-binding protein n=1 Tax=Cellulomonas denverensis TaxID=264297 RepID=UPI0035E57B57